MCRSYWLDGTRSGEIVLNNLETPTFNWALPIRAKDAQLIALKREALDRPTMALHLDIDATAGIEAAAPMTGEMVMRGAASSLTDSLVKNLSNKQRAELLKGIWKFVPGLEVKSADLKVDPSTGETRMTMKGVTKLRWFISSEGPILPLPLASVSWSYLPERKPGPGQDAPYSVLGFPSFTAASLRLKLPLNGTGFRLNAPDLDREIAGKSYYRRAELSGGVVSVETREKALRAEISAAEAREATPILDTLRAARLYVAAPLDYQPTTGEIAAWEEAEPKTATALIERGAKYAAMGRAAQAKADFEKAIMLDPSSAWAYAGRGSVLVDQHDLVGAKADLEKAIRLDVRNAQAHLGLGKLAMAEGRFKDAVSAFTSASYQSPNNVAALTARGEAYRQMGDLDHALRDTDELLRTNPNLAATRLLRMQIYTAQGSYDQALVDIDAAIAANPEDPELHTYRGALLVRMERLEEADRAFAKSLEIRPTPGAYLTRAANRPKGAVGSALSDIAAAEKLDPANPAIMWARFRVLAKAGRWQEELAPVTKAMKDKPNDRGLRLMRATAYARLGKADLAARDFAAVRSQSVGQALALNELCWTQATIGFALEAALDDCNAALAVAPRRAEILDSKGFALLRLGRWKEAIAAYDAALQLHPKLAPSLFGRGLAKRGLRQRREAEADLSTARETLPSIVQEFTDYGFTP
jgi:tetratricopeptide (TPR) repeat protein